jgi:hypothetical protein
MIIIFNFLIFRTGMLIAAKSSFEGSAQRGSLILSSPFD